MAEIAPLLTHLRPPTVCSVVRLDRFSPNFFDAEKLGFKDLRPTEAYRHVYRSISDEAVHNLAYYFTFRYQDERDPLEYMRPLVNEVKAWQRMHHDSSLFFTEDGGQVVIWDLRPVAKQAVTQLSELDSALYRACDSVADLRQLVEVSAAAGGPRSAVDVERQLQPMVENGILIRQGNRYLALAIRGGEYRPQDAAMTRLKTIAEDAPSQWSESLELMTIV